MTKIEEASKAAIDFLTRQLHANEVKITKAEKSSEGWELEAEVYEESSFIKSLGLPTKVQDKNIYEMKLDVQLEVLSYKKREAVQSGL